MKLTMLRATIMEEPILGTLPNASTVATEVVANAFATVASGAASFACGAAIVDGKPQAKPKNNAHVIVLTLNKMGFIF